MRRLAAPIRFLMDQTRRPEGMAALAIILLALFLVLIIPNHRTHADAGVEPVRPYDPYDPSAAL